MRPIKIQLSAGELSGDMHGGELVKALRALFPAVQIFGMGGENLKAAGMNVDLDFRQFAGVMGFVEVAKKFSKLLNAKNRMISLLDSQEPQCLVLIDFPDFNLRLARAAFERGIPVLYFIPPKVWAWRKKRIHLLKKYCGAVCYIFPFEQKFFKEAGLTNSFFVGHPFATEAIFASGRNRGRASLFEGLRLDPNAPTVLCLVGSRKSEVENHITPTIEALKILKEKFPNLQAIISKAPTIRFDIKVPLEDQNWMVVSAESSRHLMMNSDVGIIKSGTSTLEATFAKLPSVCIYKGGRFTIWLARRFVSISSVALPNLIAPGSMAECIQEECTATKIAAAVEPLLHDRGKAEALEKCEGVIAACTSEGAEEYNMGGTILANSVKESPYQKVANVIAKLIRIE